MCGKEYESRTGLNYHNSSTQHDLIAQQNQSLEETQTTAVDEAKSSQHCAKSPQPSSPLPSEIHDPPVKKRGRGRPRRSHLGSGKGRGSNRTTHQPPGDSSESSSVDSSSLTPMKKVTITIPSIEYPVRFPV